MYALTHQTERGFFEDVYPPSSASPIFATHPHRLTLHQLTPANVSHSKGERGRERAVTRTFAQVMRLGHKLVDVAVVAII
jgi:hypothetical protein